MTELIRKYLKGETSKLEEQKLYDWVTKDTRHLAQFKDEIRLFFPLNKNSKMDTDLAFENFKKKIEKKKLFEFRALLKYAAAALLVISGTYFINKFKIPENHTNITEIDTSIPENSRIELTLEDGTTKIIGEEKKELSFVKSKESEEKEVYNQLRVPKGELFKIILSDGSVVWLNSETKLRFPKTFLPKSTSRTVFLEGEAYFEVAHDEERPFVVSTQALNVKVLGTKFNVSSYSNDDFINTTLVEGSVKVIDSTHNNSIQLDASYQASFQKKEGKLTSKKVDPSNYIDWISHRITFNDITFNALRVKIERKYNVEITNENEALKEVRFNGQFDVESIEAILKALSTSYYFTYEIKDNQILIKK